MLESNSLSASGGWEETTSYHDAQLIEESKGCAAWKAPGYVPKHKRALGRLVNALRRRLPEAFSAPANLRPTAYLDGLRGFAALLVYWHHHELWVHGWTDQNAILENGFGYDGRYHMAAFPFIRNFFTGGHYAVSTFFVISGYVLSLKPLGLVQAGELAKLGDNLASAAFRRWPRLYLPLIAVVFAYATSWHVFGMWINGADKAASWRDEAWSLYAEFKNFSFVFKEGGVPWLSYHFHLWSIPAEFRGSMVVYASQLALSRCSRAARLWCETALVAYFMFVTDGWYCAMFCTGMLLCDLDLLAKRGELPLFLARLEPAKDFLYHHLFVLSLFLGGVPSHNTDVENLQKSRGWHHLARLKPQAVFDYKWFYLWLAATLLVSSTPRIPRLRRFFETNLCQHLGRISFALYTVHGPVLWTVGDRLYAAVGWKTDDHVQHISHWVDRFCLPRSGPLGLEVSFLVPHLILLPLTLALAEAVTRWVDTPSVNLASWLYRKTLGGGAEPVLGKQARA
ncbi:hard surface induced 3 sterol glycosyl transferase [Trichoderma cornu-damae]|uniref:Hard surface induced 3 sterol glycosyl transferase n=1 Tax=Trichoderma cornu-damae TaxID=654480 RepID=A0A9P8QUZ2_9HYPO|nr:hard surface induced 3 sterol glycosyl transferase [Trichoderma cornu-damae]